MNPTTTPPPPSPAQLIDALGGPSTLARLITSSGNEPITPQAITQWKTAGIPSSRLAQIALARGRVLRSSADLEPANWPRLFPELKAASAA
jgi:hypothetical protein